MDHLLLALVLLSVCVFESVDAAPTETDDRASTSSFEGTIADIEYLEDFYSGDQWENCASDEYQCDNDECIPSSYKCDGVNDCEDTSDELHCDPVTATIGESSTMNNLLQTTEVTEDFTFQSTEAPVVNETTGQRQTSNCTTRFNLSAGDEMILTTPNYPNHYDSLLSCLWEVSVPDDVIISVEFRSFQTETRYDVMSAGHGLGPETGSTEISRHSGGELPRSFSGSPNVWISFTSDGSIEDVGFSASISAYQVSTQASTVIETTMRRQTSNCTRRFNITAGDTMSLTTPNFPNNYDSLLRCLWTISAPDNVIIRVAFLSFQTETLYDVMSAGSGLEPGNGSTLISRHSGDELPMSFSWPSNVWISFTSDGSVEDVGFSARISAYIESTAASPVTEATGQNSDCNRRFDLSAGRTLTLTTPNFPNYYDSLLNCLWTISVPDDVIINVDFRSFETEATYDVLSAGLGLGPETGSTVISRHSGDELPSSFSGSPSIWIRFTSDGSIEGLGFSANISAYQEPSEASVVSTNSAADIALFAERKTFAEAQTSCLENGMVLFKVPSESIHTELVSLLNSLGYSNTDVWINGYQRSENTWVTTDGDDLTGYNLWAPGEPNGSGRCLQLWAALGHRLDDTPCSMMKAYICQSADSITSISPPNRLSSNSYPGTHVPPSYLPSVSSKLPEGLVQWLSPATSVVIESPNYQIRMTITSNVPGRYPQPRDTCYIIHSARLTLKTNTTHSRCGRG
ncbi:tolloid-like protein 2 isoform X2 [Ptychodera flava]|uniref:tolloid-like protein 2 isoform X2 n=1 Tax=Ptychodera flava TaxID=63121 RepID=UPI00396A6D3F